MYLLDTDIISILLKRHPSTVLIAKLASIPPSQQFTSSITLGELVYGAFRLKESAQSLLERIDKLLLANLTVLPFDSSAARGYGEIRARLESHGILTGDADLRIASIALSHNLTVVTGNVRHFERIPGLRIENWLA